MLNRVGLPAIALSCALLISWPAMTAETPPPPDFSGSWELNEERSDDPRERVAEAMRHTIDPSRRSAAAGRGGSGAAGSGGSRQAVGEEVEALVAAPRVITVRHHDPELLVASALPDQPFQATLYTDGRAFRRRDLRGESLEATASWRRGGRLVIEYSSPSGRAVEETWELVADGSRVLVSTEVAAAKLLPAIRVQRVYDRVEIIPWAVPD